MERGFLSQKGSRVGRGVKDKDLNGNKRNTTLGIGLSIELDDNMNEDTPVGVASANNSLILKKWHPYENILKEDVRIICVKDGTRFLSQKGSGGGRGVKEKKQGDGGAYSLGNNGALSGMGAAQISNTADDVGTDRNKKIISSGIGVSTDSEDTMNDDTPLGVATTIHKGVTPSVVDMTVEMGKQNSLDDTTVLKSFSLLSTLDTTTEETEFLSFVYTRGNGIDVVVPVESIRAINERVANTAYGFFLRKKLPYLLLLTMSSYARAMTVLQTDVELKDNIIMNMPKLTGVPVMYTLQVHLILTFGGSTRRTKVFGHIHEECPKNTSVGKKKTLKKPIQTSRGVPVGPKIGFKPQKEYKHVPKKPTASSSGNKKKGVVPTIEVSNSNPFEVLNWVNNDVKLGTNGETINLFEELLTSRKATLVDEAGNPLKNVEYPDDYDSEDEVASVDNDMAHFMASKRVGFGTQSLLEQWRDSVGARS
uniref:Zinc knuckle CX2CX4HX4C n=1 Tax=Tanacetum cinerariifolium TaxID=118510 RepID=A0A6L2MD10_TANCI|nr:hypothetical protein [Tanacetum cinerariifolium]